MDGFLEEGVSSAEPLQDSVQLIDVTAYPVRDVLGILLQDKTTRKNIIWATDAYSSYGEHCSDKSHILQESFFTAKPVVLQPRIEKAIEAQQERTRKKAEVFTPIWICNRMNNYCDEQWFGRPDVFNHENEDHTWTVTEGKIAFPEGKTWKNYVDSRRLEITCGEAPYIVSRYDAATGTFIEPPLRRIGILDRKLRVVGENADSEEEWLEWAIRAYQSCYGYEWQGDNLLIARINLLTSFCDYYCDKWSKKPAVDVLEQIAKVIAWNIWQMDGLKGTVPFGKPYVATRQTTLFDSFGTESSVEEGDIALPCKIYQWRRDNSLVFEDVRKMGKVDKKMFDFVIGNPPYQETQEYTSDKPIYNYFMDASYAISRHVELITPGRFLFGAGKTPKEWNRKMLDDPHIKVLMYVQDSSEVFSNTDIKGGVAITYYDEKKEIGPIGTFTVFKELNSILDKVGPFLGHGTLDDIIYLQSKWNLNKLYESHPELKDKIGSDGRERRLTTSIFSLPIFQSNEFTNSVEVMGLIDNKRVSRFVNRDFLDTVDTNLLQYKVIIPKSNGSGAIGEVLSTPLVGLPLVGFTQSFISFGSYGTEKEATACLKYIKTRFVRTLLGVLKITQDNNKGTWVKVPIQDFTDNSDIDWNQSISSIDKQLYEKYHLNQDEIDFIELHVQEMK